MDQVQEIGEGKKEIKNRRQRRPEGGSLANLLANEKAIKPLLRNLINTEDARLGRRLVSNDQTASARKGRPR